MFKTTGQTYQAFLGRWTGWVVHRPWRVVAAALLLTVSCMAYLVQNIAIDTSTGDMLSEKLDFRKNNAEMDAAFPQFSDTLLVVIDGQSIDRADAAALELTERMRTNPKLFGGVYDLAGDTFFRTNGLLYLEIDALYELSDKLADAQPFLAALWQDPSLRGLFTLLDKALAADEPVGSAPMEMAPLFDRLNAIAEAQIQGRFAELSWRALMQGDDDAEANAHRRFLLIQPALDFGSLQPASDAMDAIRELVTELKLTADNGVQVRLTGSAALEQEELESVEQGMGLAGALSFVLVMGLLIIGLRRGWLVVSCLITLVMGLIWTGGFAILALGSLNLISVAFAVLFIGLSVDFGIHYALRYQEGLARGVAPRLALVHTAEQVGGALSLSALGAAIAFYSFLPTAYNGLAELGLIAGTGMFIAFVANMTLLPALLALRPASVSSNTQPPRTVPVAVFQKTLTRRPRLLLWGFVILSLMALALTPKVVFDFDPLNLKNRQTESMATLIDLMDDSRTSPYTIDILAENLDAAEALAARLSDLEGVEAAETILDYVPADQDEKLDVITTTALFLSPALSTERQPGPSHEEQADALSRFIETAKTQGASETGESAKRLVANLEKITTRTNGIEELERRLLVHLPAQINALKDSLKAEPVTLEDLPQSLRERKIADDGRTKIEVFPKFDVTDREKLTAFVESVQALAPNAVGSPVVILEAGRAILGAFYQAGAISVGLIALLLFVVLGRLQEVFLVFAPLFIAGLYTLAASVLFGVAFNFANVIVLPLLFGLGVAGGIHLVVRARQQGGMEQATASSTPRAILFSALTTMGSFGSIALSSHPGTASMGLLLSIAITLTLICTLVFLPALMASMRVPREKSSD